MPVESETGLASTGIKFVASFPVAMTIGMVARAALAARRGLISTPYICRWTGVPLLTRQHDKFGRHRRFVGAALNGEQSRLVGLEANFCHLPTLEHE